ncbi:hypothetical protein XBO1_1940013 [Xenorhabdus bovienii str. oregonense]|uniref:Uncharacterized protein n=1 Tax=Xenorhabdus bovienii str. oregonense TaxID=1398202 RepID=A0A077NTH0_XENBV|nr:hypothetical protein XBO1_1940013 [Xenorhabdus bovienii str. oregonense]
MVAKCVCCAKVVGVNLAKNVFQVCVWLDDGSLPGTKKYVPVKTIEQQEINAP